MFEAAASRCEISNQIIKELINFKDTVVYFHQFHNHPVVEQA